VKKKKIFGKGIKIRRQTRVEKGGRGRTAANLKSKTPTRTKNDSDQGTFTRKKKVF